LAGSTGEAHPWTSHESPEWGTGKSLEMTYFRNGRHRHDN